LWTLVGFLDGTTPNETLIAALGEMGFVEGRNVVIEFRWAGGYYDSLPTFAADLVGRRRPSSLSWAPPERALPKRPPRKSRSYLQPASIRCNSGSSVISTGRTEM
jgi:hypothetical protein